MNTETTTPAEVTADAAVDAVETVIWRHEHGEEVFSGMLKDANEGVAALRELVAADEEYDRVWSLYILSETGEHAAEMDAAEDRRRAALAACRAVGGAR